MNYTQAVFLGLISLADARTVTCPMGHEHHIEEEDTHGYNFVMPVDDFDGQDPENPHIHKTIDENGFTITETCHLCKWYIEKDSYYMQLPCSHRFHKKCLELQFLTSCSCAICGLDPHISDLFDQEVYMDTQ